jgi:hypothetical protein
MIVRRAGLAALTALAMSLAAGCSTDEVLTVSDPDVVRPEAINDPPPFRSTSHRRMPRFSPATTWRVSKA